MNVDAVSPGLLTAGSEAKGMNLGEAAREFETMLLTEMLKAARSAGDAWGEKDQETGMEAYGELADQHLARAMADRQVLGVARMLVRQLSPAASAKILSPPSDKD